MNRFFLGFALTAGIAATACTSTTGGAGADTTGGDGASGPQPHFASLYADYFNKCGQCHAPGAVGATSTTEKSLDFSTQATAYATLSGNASGLTGNQAGCNGVAFIVKDKPASSLVLAVLDSATRSAIALTATPSCDTNAISDMALKVGTQPSAEFIGALKTWIQNGALND